MSENAGQYRKITVSIKDGFKWENPVEMEVIVVIQHEKTKSCCWGICSPNILHVCAKTMHFGGICLWNLYIYTQYIYI